MDGPRFKFRQSQEICFLFKTPRPVVGPSQPPTQWVPGFFPKGKAAYLTWTGTTVSCTVIRDKFLLLKLHSHVKYTSYIRCINPLNPELNPICYLLALLGAHHFLHFSRIRVKLLTLRRLMSYIYGAPILDVSRSHTTPQHSR